MAKYHVSDKTGKVAVCTAASRNACPYPDTNHFRLKSEAVKHSDRVLRNKFEAFTTLSRTQNIADNIETEQQIQKNRENLPVSASEEIMNLYADDSFTNTTESIISKYKKPSTLMNVLDNISQGVPSFIPCSRALLAVANNPNSSNAVLLRIAAFNNVSKRDVIKNTTNKQLVRFALISNDLSLRKVAMLNENIPATEVYNAILRSPAGNYSKEVLNKATKAGPFPPRQEMLSTASEIRREMNRIYQNSETQRYSSYTLSSDEKVDALAQEALENIDMSSKEYEVGKRYIKYYAFQTIYGDKLKKHIEIEKARAQARSNIINRATASTDAISKKTAARYKKNDKINIVEHEEIDYSKMDKFKNTKPMASYEDSIELQERWDKGIHDLPIDIQKQFLNKEYDNIESGLRAVVDLFKTTDTEGQMVKDGLNNFANHVAQMKEKKRKDGYLAIDNPEFMTPIGYIRIEDRIGNFDYGERMTFRINGDKFEMGKPMKSDRWTSFIHIKENAYGNDVEKAQSEVKRGFWKNLFWKVNNRLESS